MVPVTSTDKTQEPLLCEDLQPHVAVLRAKRHSALGTELKGQHAVCRISSTDLIPARRAKKNEDESSADVDEKYWKRRYNFFSRFDDGISMDEGAWFEVTPETIARHIADRMSGCRRICDATAGIGGNAIQFALTPRTSVICVDIDAERLEKCKHNASVYGVGDVIETRHGDFCQLEPCRVDAVFISPPWGGPAHLDSPHFSLKDVQCCDIEAMFATACTWSRHIVLYLPRHTDLYELAVLAARFGFYSFEVEKIYFAFPTRHLKLIVVYFGTMFANGSSFPNTRRLQFTPSPLSDFASPLPLAGPLYRSIYAGGILQRYLLRVVPGIERIRREEISAVAKFVKVPEERVKEFGVANVVQLLNRMSKEKVAFYIRR